MNTQKPNNPVKNGQSTEKEPSTAVTENVEVVEAETSRALQVLGKKTTNDVFEKLEQGNELRENFNKFKEKLDVCENFEKKYNNEALLIVVQNLGTGAEIQIQSIPMILEFVHEKVIMAGKAHLKNLENEIINFAI